MFRSGLGSLTWSDAKSWLEFAGLIRLKNFIIEAVGAQSESRVQTKIISYFGKIWLCLVGLFDLFD